jgi:hypothetical protein
MVSFDGTFWERHTFTDLFPERPFDTELQSRVYDLSITPEGILYAGTWKGYERENLEAGCFWMILNALGHERYKSPPVSHRRPLG